MKKILIAAALVGLGASSAFAADMAPAPGMYAKSPVMSSVYNWSGLYLGANLGGGWSNANLTDVTGDALFAALAPGDSFSNRMSGVIGGGQIGYNWQVASWVFGLEAMFDGAGIKGSQFPAFGAQDDYFTTRIRSMVMLTGRIGYAFNNWLPYVKGGYATGEVRASVLDTNAANGSPVGSGAGSSWRSGGTVGVGLEYGFGGNWSAAVEYDYVRFNGDRYELGDTTGSYLVNVRANQINIITGRLNYHFNSPVVARY
jgi:outer membrane immunogenic protein